jgi:hypothetical protein
MTMNVLYLQAYYSRNANPLKGRKLFDRFRTQSDECRLGYIVRPDRGGVEPRYQSDVVTFEELDQLEPDLVFLERGCLEAGEWRMPEEQIVRQVSRGAVVVISDVDWNALNEEKEPYERVCQLCRVSVAYDGNEPAELYDPVSHYGGQRQIVCRPDDIAFEGWLAPVYDGLPEFVVGLPVPLRAWVELVATCNRHSTQSTVYLGGHPFREPATGAFAAACRFGGGYLVLITGSVSDDVWAEAFPGNLEWLSRLGNHLVERVRIDRRLNVMTHQVFVSHSWTDHGFATAFGDELIRFPVISCAP